MKQGIRDFAIGLTALVGVVGLVVILMLFGEIALFADDRYIVRYRLDTAAGLVRGSSVTLNGVPIGDIEQMIVLEHPEPGVEVVASINQVVRVPRDAKVVIQTGLLGEGRLALTSPSIVGGRAPEYLVAGEVVRTRAKTMFEELAEILDERLGGLNKAAGSVTELSETYTEVGRRLNELLASRPVALVDGGAAEPNIATVIARLDTAIASTNKWLGDEALRTDAKSAVARFDGLMDEASATLTTFRDTAESLRARADSLGADAEEVFAGLNGVVESLGRTLEDVQIITGRIVDGEGAAGQFVNNPDLYRSLNDAAVRLQRVLTETQLLVEKWQKEGVPIRF